MPKASPCILLRNQLVGEDQPTCQDEATARSLLGGALRWKVKVRHIPRRRDIEPDPETSCIIPLRAMATEATSSSTATTDGKVLVPGPQACRTTVTILEAVTGGGFGSQIPARFTTWQEEDGPCTAVARWIENVQIPIISVVSLAFVSRRQRPEKMISALEFLARVFRSVTVQSELDMKVESFMNGAGRMIKIFKRFTVTFARWSARSEQRRCGKP